MNDLKLSTTTLATPACATGLGPITYQGGTSRKFRTEAAPNDADESAATTIGMTIADDLSAAWRDVAPDCPNIEIVVDERLRIVGPWSVLDEKLRPVNFEIRRGEELLLDGDGQDVYEALMGRLDADVQRQRFLARLERSQRKLQMLRNDGAQATACGIQSIGLRLRYDALAADIRFTRRLLDVLTRIES